MKIKEIISFFDTLYPFSLQESYDNSGLQIGIPDQEVHSCLICIDVTEEVIEEALKMGADIIISHHPLIFNGIKKITGQNYVQRIIRKAIQNDIAILSVHTNIDAVSGGVNSAICQKLGLKNQKILLPFEGRLLKLVFFVPNLHAVEVSQAVFDAGAGVIGNYDCCSYNLEGKGSFRAGEDTRPYVGKKGQIHYEDETRVETVLPAHLASKVLEALLRTHPYEEVAYDLYPLTNSWEQAGSGMTGELSEPMEEIEFLNNLKHIFNTGCVKYTALRNKKIKKVALCGGSGSFLINNAIHSKSDVYITSDIKYHQFFEAEGKILLVDVGHYESEQFTKEIFYEQLMKNFPKFASRLSEVNTNPINYL
jgi:dinuclear metal center YbgI/SA1388 family protein